MKTFPTILCLLATALPVVANDALEILEGNKKVEELDLAPLPADAAAATDAPPVFVEPEWVPSPLDPVWSRAVLFEDDANPWIQQLALMGLFEWGGAWGTAEVEGGRDVDIDTTRTRRARLGARLKIFGNTEIETVGEFAGDARYQRLETLKGKTHVLPDHYVEYGKFRPRFGIEGSKDPSLLLTPETAMLTNMLRPASTVGVAIGQDCAPWDWSIGWFSSDADRYLPGIEGNGFIAANLAYESAERLEGGSVMRTRWHLDYLYNLDGRRSETMPRYRPNGSMAANGPQAVPSYSSFRHLLSTGVELEGERFAFEGDFMLANGDLNAWGMTLTPSYWAVPGTLKVVGRYHYADTDDPGGLVTGLGVGTDPYFDSSPLFTGDEYHSFYLGANIHLYQDRMVILNGLEYAILKDQGGAGFDTDGWIWHSGARISF
jgi:hypothetical protein